VTSEVGRVRTWFKSKSSKCDDTTVISRISFVKLFNLHCKQKQSEPEMCTVGGVAKKVCGAG
jgi:hypothetical protein